MYSFAMIASLMKYAPQKNEAKIKRLHKQDLFFGSDRTEPYKNEEHKILGFKGYIM